MSQRIPRRQFLAGMGILALSGTGGWPASAAASVEALVLSCIDYRMIKSEQHFLQTLDLEGRYDWTALAGGSLAVAGFPHAADANAFWDQLEIAHQLHHIQRVILLDHQDCGAYALKLDPRLSQDPVREQQVHRHYLQQAKQEIQSRFAHLTVETYWATLDGQITAITTV
ncbi:MAG: carbonic anhydrase [Synechococcaceae cyanobacterium RM1_1_27]|nr:carbonic anhydrase [Synechococcaceae cyanobacterium RM1_1_27]